MFSELQRHKETVTDEEQAMALELSSLMEDRDRMKQEDLITGLITWPSDHLCKDEIAITIFLFYSVTLKRLIHMLLKLAKDVKTKHR